MTDTLESLKAQLAEKTALLADLGADLQRLAGKADVLVAEVEKLTKERDEARALREGHPSMCCGQCNATLSEKDKEIERLNAVIGDLNGTRKPTSAEEAAFKEVDRLREALIAIVDRLDGDSAFVNPDGGAEMLAAARAALSPQPPAIAAPPVQTKGG